MWWHMLVIPELESWEAEEQTIKASLNHRASWRLALEKQIKITNPFKRKKTVKHFVRNL